MALEPGKTKNEELRDLVRSCFLVHMATSSLCPHMLEGAKELSGVSFIRA